MMQRRVINTGFTLVELILVIVIVGILVAVVGPLIAGKYRAVIDARQRAEWTQQAEFALFHLRQDLQRSVPNSVRTREPVAGQDQVVELLTLDVDLRQPALRYRDRNHPDFDRLQANQDDAFDVFGTLDLTLPAYLSIAGTSASQIYSDWTDELNGQEEGSIAEINSITVRDSCDCGDCNQCPVTLVNLDNPNHRFPDDSLYFRTFFTNGPVGYQCANGRLRRHSGYTDLGDTNIGTRIGSATTSRVVDNVVGCSFSLQPGLTYQPPVLNVSLSIGNGSESVRIVDSVVLGAEP